MRILTSSPIDEKGLISIAESGDHVPQIVIFCIPIELHEAKRIINIFDFENYFSRGISTKIKNQETTNTIYLEYYSPPKNKREINSLPMFVANVKGHKIDFYLSPMNFQSDNSQRLNIDFFYSGEYLSEDLYNKRLVILEPNWRQLDKLFLEEKIIFTDWN